MNLWPTEPVAPSTPAFFIVTVIVVLLCCVVVLYCSVLFCSLSPSLVSCLFCVVFSSPLPGGKWKMENGKNESRARKIIESQV
jgi:hypothetical protein